MQSAVKHLIQSANRLKEFELGGSAEMEICAAISHPAYKSKWGSVEESEKAMIVFKNEYDRISSEMNSSPSADVVVASTPSFIRLRPSAMSTEASEISRYLLSE